MLLRKDYIPRHAQFEPLTIVRPAGTREISENVPVLDEDGSVISTFHRIKEVPLKDVINKYKDSDFKLSNLLSAGVPLSEISIVDSNEKQLDFVNYLAGKIDSIQPLIKEINSNQPIVEQKEVLNPNIENHE